MLLPLLVFGGQFFLVAAGGEAPNSWWLSGRLSWHGAHRQSY